MDGKGAWRDNVFVELSGVRSNTGSLPPCLQDCVEARAEHRPISELLAQTPTLALCCKVDEAAFCYHSKGLTVANCLQAFTRG